MCRITLPIGVSLCALGLLAVTGGCTKKVDEPSPIASAPAVPPGLPAGQTAPVPPGQPGAGQPGQPGAPQAPTLPGGQPMAPIPAQDFKDGKS